MQYLILMDSMNPNSIWKILSYLITLYTYSTWPNWKNATPEIAETYVIAY